MLRRLFLTLTLALLFGLGQQGALVHAVGHLADLQQHDRQQDKSHHNSVCDKCVVYAELGSAVGSASFDLPTASSSPVSILTCTLRSRSILHQPYTARAPPLLA